VVVSKIITFRLGRDRYDIRALRDQLRKWVRNIKVYDQ
jgi:hypothetical protein